MRRRRQDGLPRRHYRARVRGEVVVHTPDAVVRCTLVNLSLGGALVVPRVEPPAALVVGARVTVELRVAGRRGWLSAPAWVLRLDEPPGAVAVGFDGLPAALVDAIEDEVLASIDAEATPPVVVVDGMPARRRRLARAVQRVGCRPIEASTPLEAIERLEAAAVAPVAAVVGDELTQTGGAELADYLAHELPDAAVTLVRAPTSPELPELPDDDDDPGDGTVTAVDDGEGLTGRVEHLLASRLPPRRRR